MWRGVRCGGSWNRRVLVQICRAEAKEAKTGKIKHKKIQICLLLLLWIPIKMIFLEHH